MWDSRQETLPLPYKTQQRLFLLHLLFIYNVYMWKPITLLVLSNLFMTFAWYGHLKHKSTALWAVILVSWGIAFFEYCLQVPANRLGSTYFTVTQLKVMQEIITLAVFTVFSIFYFHENFRWNHFAAFCLIVGAVFLTFKEW